MATDFTETVYAVVRAIPAGTVLTYGAVAALADRPRAARAVGTALANLSSDLGVPWWRVINSTGRISTPQIHHVASVQRQLLENEGIPFTKGGRVAIREAAWTPTPEEIEALRCRVGLPADRIQGVRRTD